MSSAPRSDNRHRRRREDTRARLIAAACDYLASDVGTAASVQQLAARADVGVGTLYGHFADKHALFDAAVASTLDDFGAAFDQVNADVADPALLFANGVRATLLLRTTHRGGSEILRRLGFEFLARDTALAPRAAAGLEAARASGRLDLPGDLDTALACTAGAILGCLHLLASDPSVDPDATASSCALGLLRMFGLDDDEARDLSSRPLATVRPGTSSTGTHTRSQY